MDASFGLLLGTARCERHAMEDVMDDAWSRLQGPHFYAAIPSAVGRDGSLCGVAREVAGRQVRYPQERCCVCNDLYLAPQSMPRADLHDELRTKVSEPVAYQSGRWLLVEVR
jgi:hypothetical protein